MDVTFEAYVCGIPCQIEVLAYQPATAHGWYEEGDYEDADWIVLDRRGRRAPWLERKLQANREELERVHGEVINACRENARWHQDNDF